MALVKFGDIVKDVKISVDRKNNPYDYYVAGDHMDSEDLILRRKGRFSTDDVGPAFIRVFKLGQILYGSRRTYLKKVAVADFEGITANTTFVFETKDAKRLSQRLLPFLMLTEGFTNWSIKKSKGSTNPYILFSDLANYEFDLPPIEEQERMAGLLWAAYELKESYKTLIAATDEMVRAQFIEMFGGCTRYKKWNDLLTVKYGKAFKSDFTSAGAYPVCGSGGIMGYGDEKNCKRNTIVIGRKGNISNPFLMGTDYWLIDTAFCLEIDQEQLNPTFFYNWCKQFDFSRLNKQTALPSLTRTDLVQITMPVPDMAQQIRFERIAQQADKSQSELQRSIENIDKVMKSILP